MSKNLNIALVGNPNSGKTSLFNSLTGLNQKVGNFPGVTVDKKIGTTNIAPGFDVTIIDLPGTYSLYPKRADEWVAYKVLLNQDETVKPDMVLLVADASNLKRNLLFCSQIIDLKIPVVVALTMMDLANKSIGDTGRLAEIEVLIAQHAKARHEILVTAVYWRTNEQVTAGLTRQRPVVQQPVNPQPVAEPVKHKSVVVPFTPAKAAPRYEPLQADEVAAFKNAMALSAGSPSQGDSGKVVQTLPRSPDQFPDFEDTELVVPGSPTSPLSSTQYGDLN